MKTKDIIDIIVAIPFVVIIYTLAIICYLCEHIDNFLNGRGWTGMGLWN